MVVAETGRHARGHNYFFILASDIASIGDDDLLLLIVNIQSFDDRTHSESGLLRLSCSMKRIRSSSRFHPSPSTRRANRINHKHLLTEDMR